MERGHEVQIVVDEEDRFYAVVDDESERTMVVVYDVDRAGRITYVELDGGRCFDLDFPDPRSDVADATPCRRRMFWDGRGR